MARKIVIFQNFEKLSIFKFAYFYSLSIANQFYYCFILNITCFLVPDIELVCIWFRLDSMSIFVSIVKHTISFYNHHVFGCFFSMATNSCNFSYQYFAYAISLMLFCCMHITL